MRVRDRVQCSAGGNTNRPPHDRFRSSVGVRARTSPLGKCAGMVSMSAVVCGSETGDASGPSATKAAARVILARARGKGRAPPRGEERKSFSFGSRQHDDFNLGALRLTVLFHSDDTRSDCTRCPIVVRSRQTKAHKGGAGGVPSVHSSGVDA